METFDETASPSLRRSHHQVSVDTTEVSSGQSPSIIYPPSVQQSIEQQSSSDAKARPIPITIFSFLVTITTLGFGGWKAVASYEGRAVTTNTLDWIIGIFLALLFFWLGVIKEHNSLQSQWFFAHDCREDVRNHLAKFDEASRVLYNHLLLCLSSSSSINDGNSLPQPPISQYSSDGPPSVLPSLEGGTNLESPESRSEQVSPLVLSHRENEPGPRHNQWVDTNARMHLHNYLQTIGQAHSLSWTETFSGPSDVSFWVVTAKFNGSPIGQGKATLKKMARNLASEEALKALRGY